MLFMFFCFFSINQRQYPFEDGISLIIMKEQKRPMNLCSSLHTVTADFFSHHTHFSFKSALRRISLTYTDSLIQFLPVLNCPHWPGLTLALLIFNTIQPRPVYQFMTTSQNLKCFPTKPAWKEITAFTHNVRSAQPHFTAHFSVQKHATSIRGVPPAHFICTQFIYSSLHARIVTRKMVL